MRNWVSTSQELRPPPVIICLERATTSSDGRRAYSATSYAIRGTLFQESLRDNVNDPRSRYQAECRARFPEKVSTGCYAAKKIEELKFPRAETDTRRFKQVASVRFRSIGLRLVKMRLEPKLNKRHEVYGFVGKMSRPEAAYG